MEEEKFILSISLTTLSIIALSFVSYSGNSSIEVAEFTQILHVFLFISAITLISGVVYSAKLFRNEKVFNSLLSLSLTTASILFLNLLALHTLEAKQGALHSSRFSSPLIEILVAEAILIIAIVSLTGYGQLIHKALKKIAEIKEDKMNS